MYTLKHPMSIFDQYKASTMVENVSPGKRKNISRAHMKISYQWYCTTGTDENISQSTTVGENISRTSSLVVVISPIGPCSDPGDELTMTAHCAPSDVRTMMMIETIIIMKMGILN